MKNIPLKGVATFYDEHKRRIMVRPWVHPMHTWVGHAIFPEDGGEGMLIYYVPDEKRTEIHVHRTSIKMSRGVRLVLETDPDPETDQSLDSISWDW